MKGRCQHCRCPAGWPHTRPSSRAQHKPTPAGPQKPVEYPPDPQVSGPTLSATLRLSPPVTEARVTLTWLSAHREGLPGWGPLKAQGPRTPIPAFVDSHVSEFTHSPQTRMLCLGFAQRPPWCTLSPNPRLDEGSRSRISEPPEASRRVSLAPKPRWLPGDESPRPARTQQPPVWPRRGAASAPTARLEGREGPSGGGSRGTGSRTGREGGTRAFFI